MAHITSWRAQAPWVRDFQVEQDLIISKALVMLYEQPKIKESLIFRGGTALNKLYLRPPARYSEDLDFVQAKPEPIGNIFLAIRNALDPWLGKPTYKQSHARVTLYYRFTTEGEPPLRARLKVEINTREHHAFQGVKPIFFQVKNDWFSGESNISTYSLEELMATKLKALYDRKKGRDLFDLWITRSCDGFNPRNTLKLFYRYLKSEKRTITRAMFEKNISKKLTDSVFMHDINDLLTMENQWQPQKAALYVHQHYISKLSGEPWKGNIMSQLKEIN